MPKTLAAVAETAGKKEKAPRGKKEEAPRARQRANTAGEKTDTKEDPTEELDEAMNQGAAAGSGGATKKERVAKLKPMKGEKLQAAMLRMLLMCSLGVRELRGACYMCYVIQKESEEFKNMKEQLRAYSQKTQELGKGHGLGPPSLFAFGGLLQALKGRGQAIGAVTAEKIRGLTEVWAETDIETAHDMVPHCRLKKMFDGTLNRLELMIVHPELRETVKASLTQTGAKRLLGQAPEGGLEEALSRTLSALKSD